MKGTKGKNSWALFLLILAGIVLGGFISVLAQGTSALSWLSYGQSFGLDEPVVLNLGLLVLTFGLQVRLPSQVSLVSSLRYLFTASCNLHPECRYESKEK